MINNTIKQEISNALKSNVNKMLEKIKDTFQTDFGGDLDESQEEALEELVKQLNELVANLTITINDLKKLIKAVTGGGGVSGNLEIIIPEGATNIGKFMLNTSGTDTVVLPSTVTSISNQNIFQLWGSLGPWILKILATTPPSANPSGTLTLSSMLGSPYQIKVPASAVNTYKSTSPWSTMASSISTI